MRAARRYRFAAVPVLLSVLLTGCGGGGLTPDERLQDKVAAVIDQANARDLGGLRTATSDLRLEIERQVRAGELSSARAELLTRLLSAIERDAPLVDGEPSPTPSPTPSESPTPSPTPSQTPSPTPSPTPSEEPSATPSPTPSEEPSATPTPDPTTLVVP
jgi:hypothetical protein